MNKKILIGSIIAVAIIVLSSFSSVVGKVSTDEELVEFDVEFSGLGKKHTVSLTRQEADEVEQLFDDIEQRLSEVETREEAEEIFKDTVVELDKYGLLGDLSVKKAYRLITSKYLNSRIRLLERKFDVETLSDNENTYCLISGRITYTDFFRIPFFLLYFIDNLIGFGFASEIHEIVEDVFKILIQLSSSISIGYHTWFFEGPTYIHQSEGHIWTSGKNGIKDWEGTLEGGIDELHITHAGGFSGDVFNIGIRGFCGIKIAFGDFTNFLGFARKVKVNIV